MVPPQPTSTSQRNTLFLKAGQRYSQQAGYTILLSLSVHLLLYQLHYLQYHFCLQRNQAHEFTHPKKNGGLLQHMVMLPVNASNFCFLHILTICISNKLLCLLGLKAPVFLGKVKPKEICSEVWMRKMQSEKRLTRNMQMKIGVDINFTVEISPKKDYNIQAWLEHRFSAHSVVSRIHHKSENSFGYKI